MVVRVEEVALRLVFSRSGSLNSGEVKSRDPTTDAMTRAKPGE